MFEALEAENSRRDDKRKRPSDFFRGKARGINAEGVTKADDESSEAGVPNTP